MHTRKPFSTPTESLEHELLGEKAAALGRLGRGLEAALAELRAFDAAHPRPRTARTSGPDRPEDGARAQDDPHDHPRPHDQPQDEGKPQGDDPSGGPAAQQRRRLVAAASHALWMFAVQREALGLRETRSLMRDFDVPREVQDRMGMLPAGTTPQRRHRTS